MKVERVPGRYVALYVGTVIFGLLYLSFQEARVDMAEKAAAVWRSRAMDAWRSLERLEGGTIFPGRSREAALPSRR